MLPLCVKNHKHIMHCCATYMAFKSSECVDLPLWFPTQAGCGVGVSAARSDSIVATPQRLSSICLPIKSI